MSEMKESVLLNEITVAQPPDSAMVQYYISNRYDSAKVQEFTDAALKAVEMGLPTREANSLVHNIDLFCSEAHYKNTLVQVFKKARKEKRQTVLQAIANNPSALFTIQDVIRTL